MYVYSHRADHALISGLFCQLSYIHVCFITCQKRTTEHKNTHDINMGITIEYDTVLLCCIFPNVRSYLDYKIMKINDLLLFFI